MSDPTWTSDDTPAPLKITAMGWLRVVLRGLLISIVVFGGLAVLLVLRPFEWLMFKQNRPITQTLTVAVCRAAIRLFGIPYHVTGHLMPQPGILVANHASWLDIFALNAGGALYFVSKEEVAGWPGIGWLARATGTVFIKRDRAEASAQKALFEGRLLAGHRLLFFPEGTSTDGLQVLPFKPTLFAALFSEALQDRMWVQPVTVTYHAPKGEDPRHYGWWGDMEFATHLLQTLATRRHGRIEVVWGDPLRVSDFANRKALAKASENAVRAGHGALAGQAPAE